MSEAEGSGSAGGDSRRGAFPLLLLLSYAFNSAAAHAPALSAAAVVLCLPCMRQRCMRLSPLLLPLFLEPSPCTRQHCMCLPEVPLSIVLFWEPSLHAAALHALAVIAVIALAELSLSANLWGCLIRRRVGVGGRRAQRPQEGAPGLDGGTARALHERGQPPGAPDLAPVHPTPPPWLPLRMHALLQNTGSLGSSSCMLHGQAHLPIPVSNPCMHVSPSSLSRTPSCGRGVLCQQTKRTPRLTRC
jgi:hypothetical protein